MSASSLKEPKGETIVANTGKIMPAGGEAEIVLHDITRAAGKTRQSQVHNIEEHTVFSDSTIHHH